MALWELTHTKKNKKNIFKDGKIHSSRFTRLSFNSFESFSHQCKLMMSHWSLSDCESPQVSSTLVSILTDLNDPVVLMVNDTVFLPIIWWQYQDHHLQLVQPSLSCFIVFFSPLIRSRLLPFAVIIILIIIIIIINEWHPINKNLIIK